MKKLLTVLALVAFTSTAYAGAWTNFTNKVNNGLNTMARNEQKLNNKIDKAQAERAAQREAILKQQEAQKKAIEKREKEIKAQQEANKKALEKKKKEIEAQQKANKKALEKKKKEIKAQNEANKKAIKEEVGFWKSLFSTK